MKNRLRTVVDATLNNITVVQFYYDGLNRQIARNINAANIGVPHGAIAFQFPPSLPGGIPNVPMPGVQSFSVWDGDWAILEEYTTGSMTATNS